MKKVMFCLLVVFLSRFPAPAQSLFPFEVNVVGQGESKVVLIPGLACSGIVWDSTVKQLEDRFECHILTMPGFAGAKPVADPDLNQWVKSVEEYIVSHGLGKPVIIGHSMGGIMAMMIAADRPQSASKIVVVDALPCLAALGNPNFVSQPNPDCEMYINYLVKMDSAAFFNSQQLTTGALVANKEKAGEVLRWSLQSDKKTMGKIFCQLSNIDLREKISAVSCPALILLEPRFVQLKSSIEAQYKNLKNVDLEFADKGLHFIMYDDEIWYMNKLTTFLR